MKQFAGWGDPYPISSALPESIWMFFTLPKATLLMPTFTSDSENCPLQAGFWWTFAHGWVLIKGYCVVHPLFWCYVCLLHLFPHLQFFPRGSSFSFPSLAALLAGSSQICSFSALWAACMQWGSHRFFLFFMLPGIPCSPPQTKGLLEINSSVAYFFGLDRSK